MFYEINYVTVTVSMTGILCLNDQGYEIFHT